MQKNLVPTGADLKLEPIGRKLSDVVLILFDASQRSAEPNAKLVF